MIPTGWLTSPAGSGSAGNPRPLPVPADGFYTEPPFVAPSFDALGTPMPVAGLVSGAGSLEGRTDTFRAAQVRVRRASVFGVVLLDAATIPELTGLNRCGVRPDSAPAACGVRPPSSFTDAAGARP